MDEYCINWTTNYRKGKLRQLTSGTWLASLSFTSLRSNGVGGGDFTFKTGLPDADISMTWINFSKTGIVFASHISGL